MNCGYSWRRHKIKIKRWNVHRSSCGTTFAWDGTGQLTTDVLLQLASEPKGTMVEEGSLEDGRASPIV